MVAVVNKILDFSLLTLDLVDLAGLAFKDEPAHLTRQQKTDLKVMLIMDTVNTTIRACCYGLDLALDSAKYGEIRRAVKVIKGSTHGFSAIKYITLMQEAPQQGDAEHSKSIIGSAICHSLAMFESFYDAQVLEPYKTTIAQLQYELQKLSSPHQSIYNSSCDREPMQTVELQRQIMHQKKEALPHERAITAVKSIEFVACVPLAKSLYQQYEDFCAQYRREHQARRRVHRGPRRRLAVIIEEPDEVQRRQPEQEARLLVLLGNLEDTIPEELDEDEFFNQHVCPITLSPIRHPLRDPLTDTIYEARAIIEWVRTHGTSPLSRRQLRVADLQPMPELQAEIDEMLTIYGMD